MLSELKRAFEIGFLIFVPFLIIDMAVASILMSMGMMIAAAHGNFPAIQINFLRFG